jgi:hypothetical protein
MTLGELTALCHELLAKGQSPDKEVEIWLDTLRIHAYETHDHVEEISTVRPIVSEDIRLDFDNTIGIHVVLADIR